MTDAVKVDIVVYQVFLLIVEMAILCIVNRNNFNNDNRQQQSICYPSYNSLVI